MDSRTEQIVSEAKTALQAMYGSRLNSVILFGSYARNEQRSDADINLMISQSGRCLA